MEEIFISETLSEIAMTKVQKQRKGKELSQRKEEEFDIGADVLESIFRRVPLIYLLPASHVSKSWNRAVFSSLRHFNKPKPWLIVHAQATRPPYATAAVAYDPRSNLWLRINQNPPITYVSALRSSNCSNSGNFLYMLSFSKFSFSFDPLHLTWHHVDPPLVWRTDPIVALVGRRVIVAGGACDFEDDPLSVEIYDLDARRWDTSDFMPAILKDSAASTWLSVAADTRKLYAMEQVSGITYSFDPISRIWSGPFDLHRDNQEIYFSVIGISDDGGLLMVGLLGNPENVKGVKVWELRGESFQFCEEIGVMPKELLEKLKGERASLNSIKISLIGGFLYVYNPEEPEELVVCRSNGNGEGKFRWGSLKNAAVSESSRVAERMVLTCTQVGLGDIGNAVGSGKGCFSVVKSVNYRTFD